MLRLTVGDQGVKHEMEGRAVQTVKPAHFEGGRLSSTVVIAIVIAIFVPLVIVVEAAVVAIPVTGIKLLPVMARRYSAGGLVSS